MNTLLELMERESWWKTVFGGAVFAVGVGVRGEKT